MNIKWYSLRSGKTIMGTHFTQTLRDFLWDSWIEVVPEMLAK